eukprot:gene12876-8754_t
MWRVPGPVLAPVFCRIVDSMRQAEPYARSGIIYPTRVELGEGSRPAPARPPGEDRLAAVALPTLRLREDRPGLQPKQLRSDKIEAYKQYVVTGNMRGGYIKGDHRYGPRLTGYNGATTKPGLRWNGEDL